MRRNIERVVYLALAIALFATVFVVADCVTFSSSTRVVASLGTSPAGSAALSRHGSEQPLPLAPQSALFATVVLASLACLASPRRGTVLSVATLSTPLRI